MLEQLIKDGYYSESGQPIKCTNCESTRTVDRHVADGEKKILCASCGRYLGYWAYGSYEEF